MTPIVASSSAGARERWTRARRRRRGTCSSCACPGPSSCRWWRAAWPAAAATMRSWRSAAWIRGDTPHFEYVAGERAARPAAGDLDDRRAGDLRRAHGRDSRAGAGARGGLRCQQGRRVDGRRARDGGAHGAAVRAAVVSLANPREYSGTRSVARKLALQALYRWQLNAALAGPDPGVRRRGEDMARADREYFRTLVEGVRTRAQALDTRLATLRRSRAAPARSDRTR